MTKMLLAAYSANNNYVLFRKNGGRGRAWGRLEASQHDVYERMLLMTAEMMVECNADEGSDTMRDMRQRFLNLTTNQALYKKVMPFRNAGELGPTAAVA
jgi:hypothetical protein